MTQAPPSPVRARRPVTRRATAAVVVVGLVASGAIALATAPAAEAAAPGTSADGVSLESIDWPGYYLAAPTGGGAVTMTRGDGSAAFAARATYAPVAGAAGQGTTLQVWADRSLVLRHAGFQLYAQKADGSDLGRADSTFTISTGLAPLQRR